jgi:hypothetical protein
MLLLSKTYMVGVLNCHPLLELLMARRTSNARTATSSVLQDMVGAERGGPTSSKIYSLISAPIQIARAQNSSSAVAASGWNMKLAIGRLGDVQSEFPLRSGYTYETDQILAGDRS